MKAKKKRAYGLQLRGDIHALPAAFGGGCAVPFATHAPALGLVHREARLVLQVAPAGGQRWRVTAR